MFPETLAFDFWIASCTCWRRDAVVVQLHRVDQDEVLLDGAAEAGDVDHAGHGFEARWTTQSWTALISFRV